MWAFSLQSTDAGGRAALQLRIPALPPKGLGVAREDLVANMHFSAQGTSQMHLGFRCFVYPFCHCVVGARGPLGDWGLDVASTGYVATWPRFTLAST